MLQRQKKKGKCHQILWNEKISEPERVADPHGLCILLTVTEASTEERIEFASPQLVESKEEWHLLSVIKSQLFGLAVQQHPHFPQQVLGPQTYPGSCCSPILGVVPQSYCPIAIIWAQPDSCCPVHIVWSHSQFPLGLVAHPDFPVMLPAFKGLHGQHIHALQETSGTSGNCLRWLLLCHWSQIFGDDEVGVGRFWIQGQSSRSYGNNA